MFFPCEGFDHPDKMHSTDFPHITPFTVNFLAATPLKPNTQTMLTSWKMDWQQKKPLSYGSYRSHPLLGLRFTKTCKQLWKQEQMSSFEDFWRWYNIKYVVLILELMQEMIASYHDKDIDM